MRFSCLIDPWLRLSVLLAWLAAVALSTKQAQAEPVELVLARDGQAMLPIIVSQQASQRTREAANDLADYLGRITGAGFELHPGTGQTGLAVGTVDDFPEIADLGGFEPGHPLGQDDYLLRTHPQGVYLIGATDTAVHLAVWDLLHRVGYRLFFLTDTWEVVPRRPSLQVAVDVMERPDYVTRQAPHGTIWSDRQLWNRWRMRNRVVGSFSLNTRPIYDTILQRNQAEFEAHPEYFALVDGQRRTAGSNRKFCISNPGLRQLVMRYAVNRVKANPLLDSLSMTPTGSGNWCECSDCQAYGNVSDLVLQLANDVAVAINDLDMGPKYVGVGLYDPHIAPPSINVHPHVVLTAAVRSAPGDRTIPDLLEIQPARGAMLAVRETYDVFAWHHDQPRRARGGDIAYLTRMTALFHQQGVRFIHAEHDDSWGANGLGYWLSPRLLWDVDNGHRVDELVEDFLHHAFGSAREPMRGFYHLLNFDHDTVRTREDVVARMYRYLQQARDLADDPQVHPRLDDLILYTRYLELYDRYRRSTGAARQRAYEQLWRHTYRMQDRMMVSTFSICHEKGFADRHVSLPQGVTWTTPQPRHPWKNARPFRQEQIESILRAGIEANEPMELDFQPVAFSNDLVPAGPLNLPPVSPGQISSRSRGYAKCLIWLPQDQTSIDLTVTAGLIAHYRDRSPARFALYASQPTGLELVAENADTAPDGQPHRITLRSPSSGLHVLEWTDGNDLTEVALPRDLPVSWQSSWEDRLILPGRWSLYFYVPRGTQVVGGLATTTTGTIRSAAGQVVFDFADMTEPGYFSVNVPPGEDGTLWQFHHNTGGRMLMTVPPYLTANSDQLLLPKEVVEADAR